MTAFRKGGVGVLVAASVLVVTALIWLIMGGSPPAPALAPDVAIQPPANIVSDAPHAIPPTAQSQGTASASTEYQSTVM